MTRNEITKTFRNPPELKTERLILRRLKRTDASDMYEYACRPEVTKYLLWTPHPSKQYTERYLAYIQTRYYIGEFYDWALTLRDSGKMIGTCGFTSFDFTNGSAEIGYVLNPDYWGQGYAAEAIRAVMRIGFLVFGFHRIEAKFMEDNAQSLRVTEKVGMKFEGVRRDAMFIKGKYENIGVSAILAEEFGKQND